MWHDESSDSTLLPTDDKTKFPLFLVMELLAAVIALERLQPDVIAAMASCY